MSAGLDKVMTAPRFPRVLAAALAGILLAGCGAGQAPGTPPAAPIADPPPATAPPELPPALAPAQDAGEAGAQGLAFSFAPTAGRLEAPPADEEAR